MGGGVKGGSLNPFILSIEFVGSVSVFGDFEGSFLPINERIDSSEQRVS